MDQSAADRADPPHCSARACEEDEDSNRINSCYTSEDWYELVSSLYGPGTTACWHLTGLSCLVSWTIHPKTRISGSINSDFIALLTLPATAAGHLISQTYAYSGCKDLSDGMEDVGVSKSMAAIEAPLNITETFMAIAMILFLISVAFKCVKRALLLALIELFCFSAEGYLSISCPAIYRNSGSFHFLINFMGIEIAIFVLLVVLLSVTLSLTVTFYMRYKRDASITTPSPEGALVAQRHDDLFLESQTSYLISSMAMVFLPVAFVGSTFPLSMHIFLGSPAEVPLGFTLLGRRLVQDLFPRTNVSIKDLDQTVALLAGTTVLGFSLYSAANARYERWWTQVETTQTVQLQQIHERR